MALVAALALAQGCSGTSHHPVGGGPNSASASASASVVPLAAPPRGATDGAPEIVRQLSIGSNAWRIYSPDGHLAFGVAFGRFALVDVDTGMVRAELALACVGRATFSGDGRYLAYTDCDKKEQEKSHPIGIHVWDLARNETVDAPLHFDEMPRLFARPGGHEILAAAKGTAVVLDPWAAPASPLEARALEVPAEADIRLAQFSADGRIALWGKTELWSYPAGGVAALRTDFGPHEVVAGDVDTTRERAVVLLADGAVQVIDSSGHAALEVRPGTSRRARSTKRRIRARAVEDRWGVAHSGRRATCAARQLPVRSRQSPRRALGLRRRG